ncbi:aldehyde dehydrogenase family protein, partial [Streptomyces coeruleorubidus]
MPPTLTLKSGTTWTDAWQRCLTAAPEAFRDDRVLNLWNTAWQADGRDQLGPQQRPLAGAPGDAIQQHARRL